MPKEYKACVNSYLKKGTPVKKAKRICASAYYKKHGKTVQQAHKSSEVEIPAAWLSGLPEEAELDKPDENSTLLVVENYPIEVITEESAEGKEPKPFRFKGVACIDNAVSKNRRIYPPSFTDDVIQRTNAAIETGKNVTMYGRHGQALGSMFSLPTYLPLGRIDKLAREGKKAVYFATLAETARGKEAQILIRDGFMGSSSIRSTDYKSEEVKVGDKVYERMLSATLDGIDLADRPGIEGATITKILEEEPTYNNDGGNTAMEIDWTKVKLEDLQASVPTLLEAYATPLVTAAVDLVKSELAVRTKELAEANTQLTAVALAAVASKLERDVLEAVLNPLSKLVASKLAAEVKESSDIKVERVKVLNEEARTELLAALGIGASAPAGSGDGGDGTVTKDVKPAGKTKIPGLSEEDCNSILGVGAAGGGEDA